MLELSIIIPCFNRLDLLKLTLKSVEKAISNLNIEIILVDDGSDEPIENQLFEYKHLPLLFIRQQNSGLTTSRYNGLMAAKGEFILFLDSDDQIANDKLVKQIGAMQAEEADVSHTDVMQATLDDEYKIIPTSVTDYTDVKNPAEFYIILQPAPHSSIFRKSYLLPIITNPFIPLSREYDSIGDIWLNYNLSPYPAKIILIKEPLTIVINHVNERLTNHWERLGLCALSLMLNFVKHHPKNEPYTEDAKKHVGQMAFYTFIGLPFNIYKPFQYSFLTVWKLLGKARVINAGRKFKLISPIMGIVNAAIFVKYISRNDYQKIKTIELSELKEKSDLILNRYNGTTAN